MWNFYALAIEYDEVVSLIHLYWQLEYSGASGVVSGEAVLCVMMMLSVHWTYFLP